MNLYEMTYVVRPDLDDEAMSALTTLIGDRVASLDGEMVRSEGWGRRRLAFPLETFKEGLYVTSVFRLGGQKLRELEDQLKLTPDLLRFLVVRQEERNVKMTGSMLPHMQTHAAQAATATAPTPAAEAAETEPAASETETAGAEAGAVAALAETAVAGAETVATETETAVAEIVFPEVVAAETAPEAVAEADVEGPMAVPAVLEAVQPSVLPAEPVMEDVVESAGGDEPATAEAAVPADEAAVAPIPLDVEGPPELEQVVAEPEEPLAELTPIPGDRDDAAGSVQEETLMGDTAPVATALPSDEAAQVLAGEDEVDVQEEAETASRGEE